MATRELQLARRRAMILAIAVVITLCCLVYARFKSIEVTNLKRKIDSLNVELKTIKPSDAR